MVPDIILVYFISLNLFYHRGMWNYCACYFNFLMDFIKMLKLITFTVSFQLLAQP